MCAPVQLKRVAEQEQTLASSCQSCHQPVDRRHCCCTSSQV